MIRIWLSYMLVALIATQSVIAIADVHQSHQEGTQHLEFQHEHDSIRAMDYQLDQNTSTSSPDNYDCHHCCHCHGMSFFIVTANASGLNIDTSANPRLVFHLFYRSNLISPDIRPPIV